MLWTWALGTSMDATWEQVDSELTRCTRCGAEFRIGDGDAPCTCSTSAASASTPRAHTLLSADSTLSDAAADDLAAQIAEVGDTFYWRGEIRTISKAARKLFNCAGAFTGVKKRKGKGRPTAIEVLDETNGMGDSPYGVDERLVALGHQIRALDVWRKAAINGYTASLPDKSDIDLAAKKRLIERAEAVERRSRGH